VTTTSFDYATGKRLFLVKVYLEMHADYKTLAWTFSAMLDAGGAFVYIQSQQSFVVNTIGFLFKISYTFILSSSF